MAKPFKLPFLDQGQKFVIFSSGCLDLSANLLIGIMVLILKAYVLFSNSAVKVHDSQAYSNMEMTRECISFTFDPSDMLLSLQMGFSIVTAAVTYAILERTSGLEPSSETTAPRYLKLVTVPSFRYVTFTSL